MNNQYRKECFMSRFQKILLSVSILFVIVFAVVLFNDYHSFQENAALIAKSLESTEPSKMEAAWFAIVVYRAALFLIPAFICGFSALVLIVHDHKRYKPRR